MSVEWRVYHYINYTLYFLFLALQLCTLGFPFVVTILSGEKGTSSKKKSAWMLSIFSQHHSTQPMAPLASLRAKGFSGAMASQRNSKEA